MADTQPIEVRGLVKAYGAHVALHGLDLDVTAGEVVGLLGPNGAGKTTTIKVLLGLVRPTAGSVRLFGLEAGDPQARRRVGYLPEHFRFSDWMTGAELVDFHGRLAGLDRATRARRVPEVLREVGLAGRGDERIRGYSKGMTQRVGLAQALVAEPDLVLLDEPTSALDPIGRREVRDLIGRLRRRGCTVLLNSHLLGEVEQTCDRVVIVDRGRVVHSGDMADLATAGAELRLRLDRVDTRAVEIAGGFGQVVAVDADSGSLLLAADAPDAAPALASALVRAGYELHALVPQPRTLEDLFVSLVEETAG